MLAWDKNPAVYQRSRLLQKVPANLELLLIFSAQKSLGLPGLVVITIGLCMELLCAVDIEYSSSVLTKCLPTH